MWLPLSDLRLELATATAAARAAGVIQVDRYERLERIVHKSEKDVVTEVDHLSEAAIIEAIGSTFPDDAFLAEESGHTPSGTALAAEAGSDGPSARLWVVDPLDGTVNYANGLPFFAVSIGLVVDGVPVLGVVLDPIRGELFAAVAGRGATLDGRPIRLPAKERLDRHGRPCRPAPERLRPPQRGAPPRRSDAPARWASRRWG